jgi:transposase
VWSGEEEGVVGVEQWAEIRRLARVEQVSVREISRRTGLHRKTIRRALAAAQPPRYLRSGTGSKLDPFKDWICEQLAEDATIPSQRLRELATEIGYAGGKSIFDDFVREVRPRFVQPRTFQRTIYRPGDWCSATCGNLASGCRSVTVRLDGRGW